MLDLAAVQEVMLGAVPFSRVLGIRVESVAPERVEVVLPEAPERLNHVGTVHAAAQFGLGEAASGSMMVAAFGDLQAAGAVPLAAAATIRYRKASRGDLRGVATLAHDEQVRVRGEIEASGKGRCTVQVQLIDAEGTVTTEMSVDWVLLKRQ
ncbi:MAG: YiiD C-terminal domain-containing protein [Ktedonobacterales bacterium]